MQFLIYLAVLLLATYVATAFAPKPPKPKAARLQDFDIPTAEQGRPIPVIFGSVTVTGPNVIWYGDLDTSSIKESAGSKK